MFICVLYITFALKTKIIPPVREARSIESDTKHRDITPGQPVTQVINST
jgi:hypothetical protein